MSPLITAKEAARILNISERTLSRYDKQGITRPIQYSKNGKRHYDAAAILKILEGGQS